MDAGQAIVYFKKSLVKFFERNASKILAFGILGGVLFLAASLYSISTRLYQKSRPGPPGPPGPPGSHAVQDPEQIEQIDFLVDTSEDVEERLGRIEKWITFVSKQILMGKVPWYREEHQSGIRISEWVPGGHTYPTQRQQNSQQQS